MKENYIFSVIWKQISGNEDILKCLGLNIYTDKKIIRGSILPSLPLSYLDLPKITVLSNINARQSESIPYMDEIQFQIHAITYDETYALNIKILEYIRELIDTQVFPLDEDSGLCYWSGFWWLNEDKMSTTTPDTYDYYHTYKTEVLRKQSNRLGA